MATTTMQIVQEAHPDLKRQTFPEDLVGRIIKPQSPSPGERYSLPLGGVKGKICLEALNIRTKEVNVADIE